ncbi:hypothetical protein [Rathayibacter sp. VKM Ac-2760]|nr:hypothetical protein [Rathayibacter sp. VKM Ac-2760]
MIIPISAASMIRAECAIGKAAPRDALRGAARSTALPPESALSFS